MRPNQSNSKPETKNYTRYNVSSPVEYEKAGKTETFWQTLGSAFETEKGITVKLNGLPINGTLFLSLPKEKTE